MLETVEVVEQTKCMIGKLLESKKVSCDVEYVINELYKTGIYTKKEFDEITNILQQKKD
ncbi:hypothetical protein CUC43_06380 [Bacillus thuringiensis LM1212]|uniref:hypothetical protein n=1 Tax=Bacillus cereus group TaxID=86661 RepID=UPI000422D974|nr:MULTISPECIES: hypothetical protein [Bacillus cereus group]AXY06570.1 hypothetical protein CUC43_06380 [Bacillus thuringiensis LM1212]MEB8666654.1 hypothetical protein [Bacillus cereus]QUG98283.1 hypothetical protein HCM98_26435 [Bacillus tropicus]